MPRMDYAESRLLTTFKRQRKEIASAAWGGQWDAKEIMIVMVAHATSYKLEF